MTSDQRCVERDVDPRRQRALSTTRAIKGEASGLWRVALDGGEPEPILTNVRASRPSIDLCSGRRLVFQLTTTDMNIWRERVDQRMPPLEGYYPGLDQFHVVRQLAAVFLGRKPDYVHSGFERVRRKGRDCEQ